MPGGAGFFVAGVIFDVPFVIIYDNRQELG